MGSFWIICGWSRNKAQASLEYAMALVAIVAALLAMQVYTKRGMQGRLRQEADSLGQQYSPGNTTGSRTTTFSSNSVSLTQNLSEEQLYEEFCEAKKDNPGYDDEKCRKAVDMDGDGRLTADVFATRTLSGIGIIDGEGNFVPVPETTRETGNETVGPMGRDLFAG